MKGKFWGTKNSYAGRTVVGKENVVGKDPFMLGQRATLYTNLKEHHLSLVRNQAVLGVRESNFEQLKQQIKYLQNSQFLSLKYQCKTEPDQTQELHFRVTGKEFMPSKKLTQLQKFKLYLRRKGKARRVSLLLDRKVVEERGEGAGFAYLEAREIVACGKEAGLKKKETPSIVKKYYRPATGKNRSVQDLTAKSNSVRGRSLKSSATNREKENVLIYCY